MCGSESSTFITHIYTNTQCQWQTSVKSIWVTASASSEIRCNLGPIICLWQAQVSGNQLHWHVFWVNSCGPSGWWEADYEVLNRGKHKAATGWLDKASHCFSALTSEMTSQSWSLTLDSDFQCVLKFCPLLFFMCICTVTPKVLRPGKTDLSAGLSVYHFKDIS